MTRMVLALAFTLAAAAPALADPTADVKNAMIAFGNAKSFHVSAEAAGRNIEGDIVPPAKAHFIAGPFEMITISGTTWVKTGGGWHQFTIPGMDRITVFVNGAIDTVRNPPADLVVTDLGTKTIDGATLHGYTISNKAGNSPSTIYLDGSGTLARVEANGGSVVRFSKFNAPLQIDPPN
jgi:hypothetical protein